MFQELEEWKHVGDWVGNELVCRPDCPSMAHRKHEMTVYFKTEHKPATEGHLWQVLKSYLQGKGIELKEDWSIEV